MKKNISYIVLTAIIIGIIVVTQPWKLGRTLHNEGTDTTAVQLENCLPAEGNESIRIVPVKTCIYMENSGSMDGYVNLNSEFKDALGKIIVKSNNCSSSTDLFFVNDAIYDVQQTALKGDINNFVSQLNASNMKVGATGSSNINKIFKMVLDKTVNDTVSILFSDFVYSIKGTDVSSQISNAKNATMGAFMDAIKRNPDFATIILQCSSQFQGKYYDRNDHPIPFVGTRPYYIFIMGPYDKLKYLDEKLALNNSNTGIPGLTNKYLLSSKTWTLDENTVQALTTSYTNSLLIKPDRNGSTLTSSNSTIPIVIGTLLMHLDYPIYSWMAHTLPTRTTMKLSLEMSRLSKQNIPKTLLHLAKWHNSVHLWFFNLAWKEL